MKIYFAAPLFSKAEKEFNQILCDKLESLGFTVFLPQRDGIENDKLSSMTEEDHCIAIFNLDKEKIFECEIFLFILDGRVPDEGACVELGLAYAYRELTKSKKILIGLHTDIRAASLCSKLNSMISVPLDFVAENEMDLIDFMKKVKMGKAIPSKQ